MTGEPFLIGDAMTGGYGGGPDILHGCTISVEKGEIAVIVGPNGAGKSTAMKAVFGMLNLNSGAVRLNGVDITALSPQDRVKHGRKTSKWGPSFARIIFARRWSRSMLCFRSCMKNAIRPQANCRAGSASKSRWVAQ